MDSEQKNYVLAAPATTHHVEANVARTLSRVHAKIIELWQRFGPEAHVMLTVSVHVPTEKMLDTAVQQDDASKGDS